jgi:hypothetical protein
MKRKPRETSTGTHGMTRTIDLNRLTDVRGGGDLGIGVEKVNPTPFEMRLQHNEALVRL